MGGAPSAHAVSSTAAVLAAPTAPVALTHAGWPPLRTVAPPLCVELVATAWVLGATAAFHGGPGTRSPGAGQRLQGPLVAIWTGTPAVRVARQPTAPPS